MLERKSKLTEKQVLTIIQLFLEKGVSARELAKRYSCSVPWITKHLRESGIDIKSQVLKRNELERSKKYTDKNIKQLYKQYTKGIKIKTLSITNGIPCGKLGREFAARGLKVFTQAEWNARFRVKFSVSEIKEWHKQYLEWTPIREIAASVGLTAESIRTKFKANGLGFKRAEDWKKNSALEKLSARAVDFCTKQQFNVAVELVTRAIVKEFHHHIKKTKTAKVSEKIHLDHRHSKHDAYYNPKGLISPATLKEICHPCNLMYKSAKANLKKRSESSITITELRSKIRLFNKKHGDPFVKGYFSDFCKNICTEFETKQKGSKYAR
jgi:hypothetical protein